MVRFTEDHTAFRKVARDVVEREIAPHVDDWERAATLPAHELFPKLGDYRDAGILGVGGGTNQIMNEIISKRMGL